MFGDVRPFFAILRVFFANFAVKSFAFPVPHNLRDYQSLFWTH
jgi:hypothetical protein